MKSFIIACLVGSLLFVGISTRAQVQSVFNNETPVTWLGLDFSGALFLGDKTNYGSNEDMEGMIRAMNVLMENEYEKFDIGRTFFKDEVIKSIEVTKEHNAALDISKKFSESRNGHALIANDIQDIINSYDFGDRSGLGLMCLIESFDKTNKMSVIHFSFFDLSSKKVILSEKLEGTPVGFGLRNYWAGSIYYCLKEIRTSKYKQWKRKYLNKK